ncbi:hypothetical protein B0H13DRAFT_1908200 [Mycena leptocephala]|nr:hypothetical protein B0H13DRAFT_1908200 [Mycena leptocephala]
MFAPPAATYVSSAPLDRYEELKTRTSTPPTAIPFHCGHASNPRFRYQFSFAPTLPPKPSQSRHRKYFPLAIAEVSEATEVAWGVALEADPEQGEVELWRRVGEVVEEEGRRIWRWWTSRTTRTSGSPGAAGGMGPPDPRDHPVLQEEGEQERRQIQIDRFLPTALLYPRSIQYFWDVSQMAALQGDLPQALGYWLGSRLVEGSPVQVWPDANSLDSVLASHQGLVLGTYMAAENEPQRGHEQESPPAFIGRRIMYTRMLVHSDNGGPGEVYHAMEKAPVSWGPILIMENITSTKVLWAKATEHSEALVNAWRSEASRFLTADNLGATLKAMGFSPERARVPPSSGLSATNVEEYKTASPSEGIGRALQNPSTGGLKVDMAETIQQPPDTTLMDLKERNLAGFTEYIASDNLEGTERRRSLKVPTVEEVEDEDDFRGNIAPNNSNLVLEPSETRESEVPSEEATPRTNWKSAARAKAAAKQNRRAEEFWLNDGRMFPEEGEQEEEPDSEEEMAEEEAWRESLATEREDLGFKQEQSRKYPPKESTPIRLHKKRSPRAGASALGTSVLSVRGWLTQEESGIKGFVTVPVYTLSDDGEILESEAEAYVVPGMSVPILLGEDYMLTYEMAVTRNVETGSRIHVNDWKYSMRAEPVSRSKDANRVLLSSRILKGPGTARRHRTKLVRQKEKARKFNAERFIVRASRDYRIRAHECCSIRVNGYFDEDREWLVEKNLLANGNGSYFTVPNVLISSTNPYIPVSNPTEQPRMIRRGEAIGQLNYPASFFDKPSSKESWDEYSRAAEAMAAIIRSNLDGSSPEAGGGDNGPYGRGKAEWSR